MPVKNSEGSKGNGKVKDNSKAFDSGNDRDNSNSKVKVGSGSQDITNFSGTIK